MDDVIAAVATARGEAAIGVIRVSGRGSLQVVQRIFRPMRRPVYEPKRSHAFTLGCLENARGKEAPIDQALAAYFARPTPTPAKRWWSCICMAGMRR